MSNRSFTTQQIADQAHVDVHLVLSWIASGELRAFNVCATPNGQRPRWRIDPEDWAIFKQKRTPEAPVKVQRKRRTHRPGFVKYW